jgi:hypothetical protein
LPELSENNKVEENEDFGKYKQHIFCEKSMLILTFLEVLSLKRAKGLEFVRGTRTEIDHRQQISRVEQSKKRISLVKISKTKFSGDYSSTINWWCFLVKINQIFQTKNKVS